MGLQIYALDFQAEIEFTENCKWVIGIFGKELSFRTSKPASQEQAGFWGQWTDNMVDKPGSIVKKGQRIQISGVVRFTKKEKGWLVDSLQLTKANPVAATPTALVTPTTETKRTETVQERALKGDPPAQYELGKMYWSGKDAEKSAPKATEWWTKSAEQGYAPGQNALGMAYLLGDGVQQDKAKGIELLRAAAKQGDTKAKANLGWAYQNGKGVKEDPKEALRFFRQAAEQGHAYSQLQVGLHLLDQGNTANLKEAVKWINMAADQGDPDAQFALADMYENGKGVPLNEDKAIELYRDAAKRGDKNAVERLNRLAPNPEQAAKSCTSNLKQMLLAAQLWANDHGDLFPADILSMSNELTTTRILTCPADKSKKRAKDFQHVTPSQNVSYEYLMPRSDPSKISRAPVFRCPIHGYMALGDGTVL